MDLAPVIAMNFMRYKFYLYFSGLSREVRTPLNPRLRYYVLLIQLR